MSLLQPHSHHGPDHETLELTIRFSASIPDLPLSIPCADNATTSTLKQRIRAALPQAQANHRIRLIHAGKALEDSAPLNTSLKRSLSRPSSRVATPGPYEDGEIQSAKSKGKTAIRDPPAPQPRIYIHCSIGDVVLSPEELAKELALSRPPASTETTAAKEGDENAQGQVEPHVPAPRGFDRLLNAGFTAAEVQSLRLQFMDIQAHTHTPDTMPSPNTLRNMEDRWLDNSNNESGEGGIEGRIADEEGQAGSLDDMIWGTAMGFFWPIGCLMWGTREEGIFSPRRKIAIIIGIMLNVGLGFVRYGG